MFSANQQILALNTTSGVQLMSLNSTWKLTCTATMIQSEAGVIISILALSLGACWHHRLFGCIEF